MGKKFLLIVAVILSIILLGITQLYITKDYLKKQIKPEQIKVVEEIKEPVEEKHYNKLMIVAHPDDDTIFGGAHLIKDEYVVVCVTCGVKANRLNEFKSVMEYTNDKYIYLKHTDLIGSYIATWDTTEYNDIVSQLTNIINIKDWDLIITHNPDGEYGHPHHKAIDKIVTNAVEDKSKLYYFGVFHKKNEINDNPLENLDNDMLEKKKEALSLYVSQRLNNNSTYYYMFSHENWIKYDDWNSI